MTPSQPSAGNPTPDLVQQLLQQLDTQTKLARAAVRGMQRAMKQLEKERAEHRKADVPKPVDDSDFDDEEHEPTPEQQEKAKRFNERLINDKKARINRLFRFFPSCDEGHSPHIEAYILRKEEQWLEPMTEAYFRAILLRDFPAGIEEGYRRRTLARIVYEELVQYCNEALSYHLLSFEDADLLATAAKLEQEEQETKAKLHARELAPTGGDFHLQGRTELEEFFNREIVDIVNHHADYRALGIDFPQSVLLEGAPGCGKTYAVEQLAKHLNWHTVRIDSTAIGSTYIHATAKLIEEKFAEAEKHAPSLIIIDEMDAFMPDRAGCRDSDSHVIEEVAAFLRRLQTAAEKHILVIGMTNRKDAIDPALLRTGRFGAHLHVGMPSCEEVEAVLAHALSTRAHDTFPLRPIAEQLLNRPLSDVTHAVDRAAMHAVRHHRTTITSSDLTAALDQLQTHTAAPTHRSMGFAA